VYTHAYTRESERQRESERARERERPVELSTDKLRGCLGGKGVSTHEGRHGIVVSEQFAQ